MAKDDSKKNAKDAKKDPPPPPPKEAPKEASKDDWKEQTKADSGAANGCSSFAKILIYIIPLALYVPWAYRMFKGNACCPEVPKCPSVSHTAPGRNPFSRVGKRFPAHHDPACEPSDECGEMPDNCDRGQGKQVNVEKEREECLEQSKECLEKCMGKCFDAEKVEKKKRKKKKERRSDRECDEDDDE